MTTENRIYFWSDLHLGHENIYDKPFPSKTGSGEPMRPFGSWQEADEYMVQEYNRTIKPGDTVYFLGDIAIRKHGLSALSRMRGGKKFLIMGNHDIFEQSEYRPYFAERRIKGCLMLPEHRIVLSHIPIHPLALKKFPTVDSEPRWDYNIHGHLHDWRLPDARYKNVSVEQTNYRPVSLEEVLSWNRIW